LPKPEGNTVTSKPETKLATHTLTSLFVRDMNLVDDMMGQMTFTDAMFYHIIGQRPSKGQTAVLDAVLVTLMEHGFTPSAIAARMTYLSAPEALQAAVSAGLLNVASQFVGTMENCAAILEQLVTDEDGVEAAARRVAQSARAEKRHLPGFGHHLHKPDDPRSPKLFEIARAQDDVDGRYIDALLVLSSAVDEAYGKHLTINATGATAAVMLGIGVPARIMRGFAVISRAAGLVAHIMEEQDNPAGRTIWEVVEETIPYTGDADIKPAK
jgi:citrate synthase